MVLYINIRDIKDTNSFPDRDPIPANILATHLDCLEHDYSDRCMAFFTATFTALHDFLRSYETAVGTGKIVERWNRDMCDMQSPARARFFEKLRNEYKAVSFYLLAAIEPLLMLGLWAGTRL